MRLFKTIMIFMQCFVLLSCNNHERKLVGEIDAVTNGVYKIQIQLKYNIAGWNIYVGYPLKGDFAGDFSRNLIEKNKSVINKKMTLNIINESKFDMPIWTSSGKIIISPGSKYKFFEGTLENFIIHPNPIALGNYNGKVYKLKLEFSFEDKNIDIKVPIPIVAEWHDSM